jgi:hypothetical protein
MMRCEKSSAVSDLVCHAQLLQPWDEDGCRSNCISQSISVLKNGWEIARFVVITFVILAGFNVNDHLPEGSLGIRVRRATA